MAAVSPHKVLLREEYKYLNEVCNLLNPFLLTVLLSIHVNKLLWSLFRIKPTIAKSLSEAAKTLETAKANSNQEISIGEPCKNGGCKLVSF